MAYQFFNSNNMNKHDIAGKEYLELLDFCFEYGKYFSLTFLHSHSGSVNMRLGSKKIEQLEPFLYDSFETEEESWYHDGPSANIKIYFCNKDTKNLLREQANHLFAWSTYEYQLPEDLSFFRSDGSAVFHLLTHEGIATIYNKENEIIPESVLQPPWGQYEPDPDIVPLIYTAKRIKKQHISAKQKAFLKNINQHVHTSRPGWKKRKY